jgi:hypothetical protein
VEEAKYNKSFLIILIFSLALMILHLFVIEISFIGDASSTVLGGWFIGLFLNRVFRDFKYKAILFTVVFLGLVYMVFIEQLSMPSYVIFLMVFILLLNEAIKRKTKYIKLEVIVTLVLFITFFSLNYYFSSTRLVKSLNLNKVIAMENHLLDEISEKSLLEVSSLSIKKSHFVVTDLQGIEYMKNLYMISLDDDGMIKDYTPIQELKKINKLFLWWGNLDKLESLDEMVSLETLDIAYPKKGYLNSLKSFPNLKNLSVHGGDLSDVSTLQGPKNLKSLTIADCKVRNFQGIENFATLEEIALYELNIDDSSKLLTLKNLKKITIEGCKVNDIENLKRNAHDLGIIIEERESFNFKRAI